MKCEVNSNAENPAFFERICKIRNKGILPERFLNLCSHHQIDIWGLQPCKNSYEMYVKLKDFRKSSDREKNAHEGHFSGTLRHAVFYHKVSEQNMVSRRSCALYTPVDVPTLRLSGISILKEMKNGRMKYCFISGAGEDHTCHAKREGRLRGYRAEGFGRNMMILCGSQLHRWKQAENTDQGE